MKYALLLLCFSIPALGQKVTVPTDTAAPKGYPTLFTVQEAWIKPGVMFGRAMECYLALETDGQIYRVSGGPGWTTGCAFFRPGQKVYGHVHRMLGVVVDIQYAEDGKNKSHRYTVQNVELVANQHPDN